MKAVRIALIGCGRMGSAHLAAAEDVSEVEIVAVVDPAVQPPSYPSRSWQEALFAADIEAVLIAASTPAHEELVRQAIEQDKHVLCEKPLTLDPCADSLLGRLAAEKKTILQVGFWRRFAEPYLLLRDVLAAGSIGDVKAIRTAQWDAFVPSPAFCDPRVSGGIEIDCGVHEFDIVRWLLRSEIEAVTACSSWELPGLGAVGDVDTVYGLARLGEGRVMTIDLARTAGHRDSIRTEVIGERGAAVVDFAESGSLVVRHGDYLDVTELAADTIGGGLRNQLRAFARAVRTGTLSRDAATADDSRCALRAAQVLQQSRRSGTWRPVQP